MRGRRIVGALLVAVSLAAAPTLAGAGQALAAPAASSVTAAPAAVTATAPLLVIGFGDSVPSGTNCRCTPFPGLVAGGWAATPGPATGLNLARGGLTSSTLLAQLDTAAARQAVADSDVVLVTIGANDFSERIVTRWSCSAAARQACYRTQLSRLRTNVDALLQRIVSRQTHHGARVLITGYWDVFKDGKVAHARGWTYIHNATALTVRVNAIIAASAARNGAQYVDIFTPFRGNGSTDDTALLAADGDHPNARGHQVIARTLLAALAGPGPARP